MQYRQYLIFCLLVGLLGFSSGPSYALQGGEDPNTLPILLEKKHGLRHRHQLSALFSVPLVTKFTQATGGALAYHYYFSDMWGLGLGGGIFQSEETTLTEAVRTSLSTEPLLSDLYQMQWNADLNVFFLPVYGKMSFATEFNPSFDVFLTAGLSAIGTRRALGNSLQNPIYVQKTVPGANLGLGLRFYAGRHWAARIEFRDYFYKEPTSKSLLTDKGSLSLTSNAQFQFGLQYTFGG